MDGDDQNQGEGIARCRKPLYLSVAVAWLGVVLLALWQMLAYSFAAAPPTPGAKQWPWLTQVEHSRTIPTLVVALHPHCSCSRATLEELAIVAAHCAGRFSAQVLFYRPSTSLPSWSDTDLKSAVLRIPGAHVVDDPGGIEAAHFQAATSGEIFLYDILGRLLFHGGITASRGHSGDNYGRDTLISLLHHDSDPQRISTPIFGCSLRSTQRSQTRRTL